MNNQLIAEYHHKIPPGFVSFMFILILNFYLKQILFRLRLFNIKVILQLQVLVNCEKQNYLIFF